MDKEKISIIGAGKVGSALACLLAAKGYKIINVYSKSNQSAEALASKVAAVAVKDISLVAVNSDIILLTTPDSVINSVVRLIAAKNIAGLGKFIFHTCGSQECNVLKPLEKLDWTIGSLHPLQAFADCEMAIKALPNSYFAIDGSAAAQNIAKQLIDSIGGKYFNVPGSKRALYHAAACVASNYTVAVMHSATQLLAKVGISEAMAIEALTPLMQGSFANIKEQGTINGLTGPIVRGDAVTIAKHLAAIKLLAPEEAAIYKTLGEYTLDMSKKRDALTAEQEKSLRELLS